MDKKPKINPIIRLETGEVQIEYAHRINQELGPIVCTRQCRTNMERNQERCEMAGKNSNEMINKKRNT